MSKTNIDEHIAPPEPDIPRLGDKRAGWHRCEDLAFRWRCCDCGDPDCKLVGLEILHAGNVTQVIWMGWATLLRMVEDGLAVARRQMSESEASGRKGPHDGSSPVQAQHKT